MKVMISDQDLVNLLDSGGTLRLFDRDGHRVPLDDVNDIEKCINDIINIGGEIIIYDVNNNVKFRLGTW